MSETQAIDKSLFSNQEYFSHYLTNEKGDLIEVPLRRGQSDGAFIDYLRFNCDVRVLNKNILFSEVSVSLDEQVSELSRFLYEIFGFGIVGDRLGKGKFFYENYYQLGGKEANYGEVHIGGNGGKFLVSINGTGCQAALPDWENRLYLFAEQEQSFSISRADVAKDFFNGEYTPEEAYLDWCNGLYDVRNSRPKFRREGTDWECNDDTGKTAYIGTRKYSSKYTRIYEKGKQLGDKNSRWVRFEVEYRKSKSRDQKFNIPIDILIHAGQYLGGAYENLYSKGLFIGGVARIEYKTEAINIVFESKLKFAKQQVGGIVRLLFDMGWSDTRIRETLIGEAGKYPKGLDPAVYDCQDAKNPYYHEQVGYEPSEAETIFVKFNQLIADLRQDEMKWWIDSETEQPFEVWREKNQCQSFLFEKDLAIWLRENRQEMQTDWLLLKYQNLFNQQSTQ